LGGFEAYRPPATLDRLKKAQLRADGSVPPGLEGPRTLILDEAEQWKEDLIIAGSHGRHGWDRP
jgi:nucleotide-binding universal stress UspA family protein